MSTPGLILKVVHLLVRLVYLHYNAGGVIESKVNKEHHLSLSGDVDYSLRVSCKTLETRFVEILFSASYFRGSRFESCFGIRLPSLTGLVMSFRIHYQEKPDIISSHLFYIYSILD